MGVEGTTPAFGKDRVDEHGVLAAHWPRGLLFLSCFEQLRAAGADNGV